MTGRTPRSPPRCWRCWPRTARAPPSSASASGWRATRSSRASASGRATRSRITATGIVMCFRCSDLARCRPTCSAHSRPSSASVASRRASSAPLRGCAIPCSIRCCSGRDCSSRAGAGAASTPWRATRRPCSRDSRIGCAPATSCCCTTAMRRAPARAGPWCSRCCPPCSRPSSSADCARSRCARRRPEPVAPLHILHFTATSCLGAGLAPLRTALAQARSGLKPCDFETVRLETQIGEVPGVDAVSLPPPLGAYDCRNNRLAELGLRQDGFRAAVTACAARWGRERIGVFIGTSTSGILETEIAFRARPALGGELPAGFDYRHRQNSFSISDYVRRALALTGPAASLCTACSSSAKAFAAAQRLIEAGLIDAAVVGGVDSLCLTTLYGFHALQLVARTACRPFDRARDGLSIGEAAAYALLERAPAAA